MGFCGAGVGVWVWVWGEDVRGVGIGEVGRGGVWRVYIALIWAGPLVWSREHKAVTTKPFMSRKACALCLPTLELYFPFIGHESRRTLNALSQMKADV